MGPMAGCQRLRSSVLVCCIVGCISQVMGMVTITTPQNASFQFSDADAAFGGVIPAHGIRGVLYRADPPDACERLDFHRNTTGAAFALVERGNCVFDIKVGYAQLAGFSAIIVYNNDLGRELITMSGRHSSDIAIPAVFVTNADGKQLLALVNQPGTKCTMTRTFDSTAWSVMAVSFISLLAVSAVLATFFFVRRHRLQRVGSRLLLVSVQDDGMTSRQVKALPSSVFKRGGQGNGTTEPCAVCQGNGTTETCAICLDDYEEGEKLRILPCNHEFHMVCVDQWLTTRRPFCPVCKRDARTSNPSPVPTEQTPLLGAIFGSAARSSSSRQARTSRDGGGANSEAGPSMVHEEEAGIPGARLGGGNGIVAVDMPAAAGEVPSTSASRSVPSIGGG